MSYEIDMLVNERNSLSDKMKRYERIIRSYQLDIRISEETIGIDLIKLGFCQGGIYKDMQKEIDKLSPNTD